MAEEIEINLGEVLKEVSEAKEGLIRDLLETLLEMGAKVNLNLEDTEVHLGEYKLSLSGNLKLKTELSKK